MLGAVSEESEAYHSQLIIYSDQPPDLPAAINEKAIYRPGPAHATLQRPGPVTDVTDRVLAALRAKAVLPVVTSLLTAEELEDLHLAWGVPPHERDLWVHLVARREVFEDLLDSPDWADGGDLDAVTRAWRTTCRTGCVRPLSPGPSCAPSITRCRRPDRATAGRWANRYACHSPSSLR